MYPPMFAGFLHRLPCYCCCCSSCHAQ